MKKYTKYLYFVIIVTFVGCNFLFSQINHEKFYEAFQKANTKDKVKMVANEQYENIKIIFPLISDTLENIKKNIYLKTNYKEARFYFDKIDINIDAYHKNYAKAISKLLKTLSENCSTLDDSLWCYINLKNCYLEIKDGIKAIDMNRFIEQNYNNRQDKSLEYGEAKSKLYSSIGMYRESIIERKKEKTWPRNLPMFADVSLNNDVGHFYNKLNKFDSAAHYFLLAKTALKKIQTTPQTEKTIKFYYDLIGGNLAYSKFYSGNYSEAIPLLEADVEASNASKEYRSAYNAYLMLIKTYLKLNSSQKAKIYLDTLQAFQKRFPDMFCDSKINLIYGEYYNLIKDYKQASQHFNQYIQSNDSVLSIEKERHFINQSVAYNVQNKELELRQKNIILANAKLEESKQKTYRAYTITGIILLIAIIILLVLNNQYSKKREKELAQINKQIQSQNIIIEQSLKEKEILLKEIHHRVKNNLQIITSMLSLQIGKTSSEESSFILNEAKQRIASIALTHQMLYQKGNLSSLQLDDFISKLVLQIESTIPQNNVTISLNLQSNNTSINIDTAIPLGLIINEIITNCFKHAFPNNRTGNINVSLIKELNQLVLTIKDDGIGFNVENASQNKSLGLELIEILAEQLNASLKTINENGTKYILTLNTN